MSAADRADDLPLVEAPASPTAVTVPPPAEPPQRFIETTRQLLTHRNADDPFAMPCLHCFGVLYTGKSLGPLALALECKKVLGGAKCTGCRKLNRVKLGKDGLEQCLAIPYEFKPVVEKIMMFVASTTASTQFPHGDVKEVVKDIRSALKGATAASQESSLLRRAIGDVISLQRDTKTELAKLKASLSELSREHPDSETGQRKRVCRQRTSTGSHASKPQRRRRVRPVGPKVESMDDAPIAAEGTLRSSANGAPALKLEGLPDAESLTSDSAGFFPADASS
ncbi:MAG: hypothetical protein Q9174_001992 [Haloplaca sp. 1 TL-2023]